MLHRARAFFLRGYAFLVMDVGGRGGDDEGLAAWLIDTGASVCVVDKRYAATAGVRRDGDTIDIAGERRRTSRTVRVPRLAVTSADGSDEVRGELDDASLVSTNVIAIVRDLSALWRTIGVRRSEGVVGILGYTWLKRYVLRIDYRQHTVRLKVASTKRQEMASNDDEARGKLEVRGELDDSLALQTRLNGHHLILVNAALDNLDDIGDGCCGQRRRASCGDATWWIVDTGADACLVGRDAVRMWRLPARKRGDRTVGFSLADGDGDMHLVSRRFDALYLRTADDEVRGEPDSLKSPPTRVLLDERGEVHALHCAAVGTLGNDFWRRMGVLWLDYRRSSSMVRIE